MTMSANVTVHPDHVRAWGSAFGDPELAQRIFENPRLKARAAARIAELRGVQPVAGADHRRISVKAVNDIVVNRDRFARIAGLVSLRGLLRGAITREAYQLLSNAVPHDELDLAASLAAELPRSSPVQIDPQRLGERVLAEGLCVLATWAETLPGELRAKLELAFGEEPFHPGEASDNAAMYDKAVVIVELIARGQHPQKGEDYHA